MMKHIIISVIIGCIMVLSMTSLAMAKERYRIQVENKDGGEIRVSYDQGANWQEVGHVIHGANSLSMNGFAASTFGKSSAVVATAVNAIHIKVRQDNNPILFSILPKEMSDPSQRPDSYFSNNSSIFTDIPGGSAIFGGGLAPFVGSDVYINDKPMSEDYTPTEGDTVTLLVENPPLKAAQLIFENKEGGRVLLKEYNGRVTQVAVVDQPFGGTGRFGGSLYAEVGRIRANHPGVICISTSRFGEIGGFQVVPSFHASHLPYTQKADQWMIVSSYKTKDLEEGKEPLFARYIQPSYQEDNWNNNYLVDVRINDGDWQPMPLVEGLTYGTLKNVTEMRIFIPNYKK